MLSRRKGYTISVGAEVGMKKAIHCENACNKYQETSSS